MMKQLPTRLNLGYGCRPLLGHINVEANTLDQIRRGYPNQHLENGLLVEQHDIFNLPTPSNSVDEIRAEGLIEDVSFADDLRFFIGIGRVMRIGGIL